MITRIYIRIFVAAILFIFTGVRVSHAQWVKQSPFPTAEDITCISFLDAGTGWIFGNNGTVFRTDDGGETWIDQSLPSSGRINAGIFLDKETGWAALSGSQDHDGEIYGTTDGGKHWDLQFADHSMAVRDLSFLDRDTGWALVYFRQDYPIVTGRNLFLKTTDGGHTWLILAFIEQSHFNKVEFIDDTTGYIAGAGIPNLMKTIDGGLSWHESPHASNMDLTDICFTDITNGYSCGKNFYFTHNAGMSWHYTNCYYATNLSMYDTFNGWTVTADKVYKVSDGGNQVIYQHTLNKSLIVDISAIDSLHAFVAGKSTALFSTCDGGQSWQEKSNGTSSDLTCVFFLDADAGWAGGTDGTVLRTRDGGTHWSASEHFNINPVYDIQFASPDTGWLADGAVYRSTDGGHTWIQASSPDYPVVSLYFNDSHTGWCVGPGGRLFKSTNGGIDWEEKNSGTGHDLHDVYFIDQDAGWIAGDSIVRKTVDGGETWTDSYLGSAGFSKIQFPDEMTGYILADSFYIKTSTGGDSWEIVVPDGMPGNATLNDIFFINQDIGYLSGNDFLMKTSDGGLEWEKCPELPAMHPKAIFFTGELKGWIVGDKGAIYKTETGGAPSVEDHPGKDHSLTFSIFPNPASGKISINYRLENPGDVEIGIYDMLGTRVMCYHQKGLIPGNYSQTWDPALFSSGIYICRIRSGEFTCTDKFMFIKN